MEVILSILPELVALAIAVAVVVARTTDTKIDDKVARLARQNQGKINDAIRDVLADEDNKKGR